METAEMPRSKPNEAPEPDAPKQFRNRRFKFFGIDSDTMFKAFFGGNATVAIIILVLITFFLFREGVGFFGQNREQLTSYRRTGLEFVDKMRGQIESFYALSRFLTHIKVEQMEQMSEAEIAASPRLEAFSEFHIRFTDSIQANQALVDELKSVAIKLRNDHNSNENNRKTRVRMEGELAAALAAGDEALAKVKADAIAALNVRDIDFAARRKPLRDALPRYIELSDALQAQVIAMAGQVPSLPDASAQEDIEKFTELAARFVADQEQVEQELRAWDAEKPVSFGREVTTFIFGSDWITNSFFQDWYGLIPLLVGSLIVSSIALAIGVPLGVAAAIYVSQIASPREQRFIKPYIEFISAIPSVVIGFFGVLVWGAFVRDASHWAIFSWLPFTPVAERLNAFTAGCLLALMAIPTIFTLAEDSLNNVPKAFKEASFAVGATRLQTAVRIVVPTALSGIISAILLGFGRVIGETMVVLLCAGNRIALPDASQGLGVFFEPVHTMTGIVAQEMGEVVPGSIHYRALFLVGTALFFISLLINYMAQKIVRRYRIAAN